MNHAAWKNPHVFSLVAGLSLFTLSVVFAGAGTSSHHGDSEAPPAAELGQAGPVWDTTLADGPDSPLEDFTPGPPAWATTLADRPLDLE